MTPRSWVIALEVRPRPVWGTTTPPHHRHHLCAYLLVGQQRVGLQRAQVAVDERRGSVVFTEQAAVDVVESISGNQSVPAGGACETLWCRGAEPDKERESGHEREREILS